MASVSQNPYTTYKDCSQGICSIYCPQWCYFIFPPPPPFTIGDDGSDTTDFSPLIIAVIGILASAFILISYYTIISKYCRRRGGGGGGAGGQNSMELNDQNRGQTPYASSGSGLDETLIKSITVCKYKKNDGFIEGTDCSVCLSEFEEDESLRLLPKCSHAFHLPCIDPWLKAHASCPLCRANIASPNIYPVQESAPPVQETNVSAQEYQHRIDDAVLVIQDLVGSVREEVAVVSLAAADDDHVPQKDIEAQDHPIQPIRRSVSLNFPVCETQFPISISIADILCNTEEEEDDDGADEQVRDKGKKKSGILNMVRSSAEMKRSISTGRFMFTMYEKGRGSTIPN